MNKAPCQRSHGLRFEPGTAVVKCGIFNLSLSDSARRGSLCCALCLISTPPLHVVLQVFLFQKDMLVYFIFWSRFCGTQSIII